MFVLSLIWKNLRRHKLRSFLTLSGIAIAVLAFGVLRTVDSAWNPQCPSRSVTSTSASLVLWPSRRLSARFTAFGPA